MKKALSLLLTSLIVLSFTACAASSQKADSQKVQPQNIDKNNVGVTSGEKLDQTDPTLIEGNLEDNDFKN